MDLNKTDTNQKKQSDNYERKMKEDILSTKFDSELLLSHGKKEV